MADNVWSGCELDTHNYYIENWWFSIVVSLK